LFGFRSFFVDALIVSVPLVVLRVPRLRTWWVHARRGGVHRGARRALSVAALAVFGIGFVPFVVELVHVGVGAFVLHPPS
jgi:hypothetical protein